MFEVTLNMLPIATPKVLLGADGLPLKGKTILIKDAKTGSFTLIQLDPAVHTVERLDEGCRKRLVFVPILSELAISGQKVDDQPATVVK